MLYKALFQAVVNLTLIVTNETLSIYMCLADKYVRYAAGKKAIKAHHTFLSTCFLLHV